MLPPIRTLSDHEIQHEQMGLARLNDSIIVQLTDLNSRPAAGIFGKGLCQITTPTTNIVCESNGVSWTSQGSGPVADRPSASLFGVGTWQDGATIYPSNGVFWGIPNTNRNIAPLYIENFISNQPNINPPSVFGATLVVSGTKGARVLNIISGTVASFQPTTGKGVAAVLADDTGNDFYFVTCNEVKATTIDILEPLPITVTNAVITSRDINAIHYTESGNRAYAKHLLDVDPTIAQIPNLNSIYCLDCGDNWSAANGLPHIWQPSGASYSAGSLTYAYSNNLWDSVNFWSYAARSRTHRITYNGTGAADMTAKIPLSGMTNGFVVLECCVSSDTIDAQVAEQEAAGIVTVNVTSRSDYGAGSAFTKTKIYTGKFYKGVKRFVIPFTADNEVEVIVGRDTTDGATGYKYLRIGKFDVVTGSIQPQKSIIDPVDTIMVFGDSWTDEDPAGYPGFIDELRKRSGATILSNFNYTYPGDASPSVIKSALGGTTTARGLAWLDIALKANPHVNKVVFNYFTNDLNDATTTARNFTSPLKTTVDYNVCNYAGITPSQGNCQNLWANNIRKLIDICLSNGVQPIVMMPAAVAGGNSQIHGTANYLVGQPQQLKSTFDTATAADLALKLNPMNNRGKYKGKVVIDQSPGGASIAMYIANGSAQLDTWSLFGSATVITPA